MRVLSGTQPTGANLHVGNYLGALRQYVEFQDKADEALYFIADYHSMTTVRDADLRHAQSQAVALDYLAAGLDPERALLFRQSDVPQVCELSWILSTVTPMGLLERSHAYKDRIANGQSADHGLFAYPVLMASDVLIYHADIVPVGQDQKQHLEMARDMAQRFNHAYDTEALKLFDPYILEDSAVVPGTDGRKMSKSYGNTIPMFAPQKQLKKSVMGIVTDSTPVEDPKDPNAVVFQLWKLFANANEQAEMAERAQAGGLGWGDVKKDLLARILDYFGPMRERRADFEKRPDDVRDILLRGAAGARALADPVLEGCREAAGLGTRRG
jgi:tryptophanyl-tRNA synthetase